MKQIAITIKYQTSNLASSAFVWDGFCTKLNRTIKEGRSDSFVVSVPSPLSKREAEQWAQAIKEMVIQKHNCPVYYHFNNATYTADIGDEYFKEVTYYFWFSVE